MILCSCSFIFLHKIQYPYRPDFDHPERYGIAPGKARNLNIITSDGVRLGAWHVLPDGYHRTLQPEPFSSPVTLSSADYDRALCEHPTIIYLHGNAANRAAPLRIASYVQFTARLQANVVAIDYRGFGDSEGIPTEEGLVKDALAAWEWVQTKRRRCTSISLLPGEGVVFVAQSLGTGVGAQAVRLLTEAGNPPQALVLLAPYRSLRKLVAEYRIGGVVPILAPALLIPYANYFLDKGLQTIFASDEALPALYADITSRAEPASPGPNHAWPHLVISHATNDEVIPYSHGENLFVTLVKSDMERLRHYDKQVEGASVKRRPITDSQTLAETLSTSGMTVPMLPEALMAEANVLTRVIPGWARVERFFFGGRRGSHKPSVTLIRTESGGHNTVGEGVVDIVREVVRIVDGGMNFA